MEIMLAKEVMEVTAAAKSTQAAGMLLLVRFLAAALDTHIQIVIMVELNLQEVQGMVAEDKRSFTYNIVELILLPLYNLILFPSIEKNT
jgi:hypothetical protein